MAEHIISLFLPSLSENIPAGMLAIIPANADLAGAEVELVNVLGRENRLKKGLGPVAGQYDFTGQARNIQGLEGAQGHFIVGAEHGIYRRKGFEQFYGQRKCFIGMPVGALAGHYINAAILGDCFDEAGLAGLGDGGPRGGGRRAPGGRDGLPRCRDPRPGR